MIAREWPLLEEFVDAWLARRAHDPDDEKMPVDGDRPHDPIFLTIARAELCAQTLLAAWPGQAAADDLTLDTADGSSIVTEIPPAPPSPVRQVGRFEIRRLLGEGGMGRVYLALDPVLRRNVALKIPHPGLLIQQRTRERFLREAQAAGMLRHPNLMQVYESGQADGVCFIASQYCAGPTLAEWLRRCRDPVPLRTAARIVAILAEAMQHAHDRGILHRDLKPSNVLLDPVSDRPIPGQHRSAHFPYVLRISDFGLAQIEDEDQTLTQTGAAFGTAAYMAPEQAAGRRAMLGPRTDVYALGVILYELITGTPAFQKQSVVETLAAVQTNDAASPRRLRRDVPGDLEAICLKAMSKEREERYRTAGELSDDLERFLTSQPVLARPVGVLQRVSKWARRKPALAALFVLAHIVGVCGLAAVYWHTQRLENALALSELSNLRAEAAEHSALEDQRRLEEELYATDTTLAYNAWREGDVRHASDLLEQYLPQSYGRRLSEELDSRRPPPSAGGETVDGNPPEDIRGWEWGFLWRNVRGEHLERSAHDGAGYYVEYSPDGTRIATAGAEGVVRIFDADRLSELRTLDTCQGEVNSVVFDRSGSRIVTAGDDGTVKIWDLTSDRKPLCVQLPDKAFVGLLADNERLLVTCGSHRDIQVWDARTGKSIRTLTGHTGPVEGIAIAGNRLVSASSDDTVKVWELDSGRLLHTTSELDGHGTCVSFSPDLRLVAAGDVSGNVHIWSNDTMQRLRTLPHLDGVQSLAFSRDSKWLSVGTRSGNAHHWAVQEETGRTDAAENEDSKFSWQAHARRIYRMAYGPDDRRLATIGRDGNLKLWTPRHTKPAVRSYDLPNAPLHDLAILPSGDELLTVDRTELRIWNRETRRSRLLAAVPHADLYYLGVSPSGRRIAAVGDDGQLFDGDLQRGLDAGPWDLGGGVWQLQFVGEKHVLVNIEREHLQLLSLETRQVERSWELDDCYYFAISPDDRWLAAGDLNDVVVWDLQTSDPPRRLSGHTSTVRALAFSAQGDLASAAHDRRIKIWSWPEGKERHSLEGNRNPAKFLCFSLDGGTLFSSGADVPLNVWHVATGRRLFSLNEGTTGICVGPAAGQMAGRSHNGVGWVLDFAPLDDS